MYLSIALIFSLKRNLVGLYLSFCTLNLVLNLSIEKLSHIFYTGLSKCPRRYEWGNVTCNYRLYVVNSFLLCPVEMFFSFAFFEILRQFIQTFQEFRETMRVPDSVTRLDTVGRTSFRQAYSLSNLASRFMSSPMISQKSSLPSGTTEPAVRTFNSLRTSTCSIYCKYVSYKYKTNIHYLRIR